jgi:hypothetical protein
MKKSLKPALIFSLLFFTATALLVLSYVGIKLECEVMVKEKVNAEDRLETGLNTKIDYTARYQLLNSEERITGIAQTELGMLRDSTSSSSIFISTEEINRVAAASSGGQYD